MYLLTPDWVSYRKLVGVSLIVLSALILIPSHYVSPVRASSAQPWSFRDDFNYTNMSQLEAAGWMNNSQTANYYAVGSSQLTLRSTATLPGAVYWKSMPSNVSNWSVSVRGEWVGNSYGSIEDDVRTAGHVYTWIADGSQNKFILYEGTQYQSTGTQALTSFSGYTAQLNVWHILQLDMINGTLYMYFDGSLLGTFNTTDTTPGNTNLTMLQVSSSPYSYDSFDWIQASSFPVLPAPFFTLTSSGSSISLGYHQSVNATITVTSIGQFTGTVNLVASSQLGGPSVTMVPAKVSVSNGGSALSILKLQAPVDPISTATYSVNVTGLSGPLSSTVAISVVVDTHAPVYINGNSGFTAANGVSGGSGTKSDPYIISGFAIDLCQPGKLCAGWGIVVNNTSMSFIISNVYVHSSGPMRAFGYYDADVFLLNVANAAVTNSTLANDRSGVTVSGSTNITISGNRISDLPIYTVTGQGTSLQVTGPCITVSWSTSIVVSGNTASPCVGGISAYKAGNLLVFHNNFLAGASMAGAPFAADSQATNNKWDNGYPSGGNYWANYNGTDNCSGPRQNLCPSPDGIGDTPYAFSSSQDNYPLMTPFAGPAPILSITETFSFVGFNVTTSGSLSISSGTVTGTISATAVNSTTGAMLFSKTYTISNLKINGNSTRFLLNVGVNPDPLSADIMLTQTGGVWSAKVMVTRQLDIAARGTVDIVDVGIISSAFDSYPGSPLYSARTDVGAMGSIDIVDVGMLFFFYGALDYS